MPDMCWSWDRQECLCSSLCTEVSGADILSELRLRQLHPVEQVGVDSVRVADGEVSAGGT